jgi:hypothetical protein
MKMNFLGFPILRDTKMFRCRGTILIWGWANMTIPSRELINCKPFLVASTVTSKCKYPTKENSVTDLQALSVLE